MKQILWICVYQIFLPCGTQPYVFERSEFDNCACGLKETVSAGLRAVIKVIVFHTVRAGAIFKGYSMKNSLKWSIWGGERQRAKNIEKLFAILVLFVFMDFESLLDFFC